MRKIAMLMSLVASTISWAGERTVTICLAPHPEVNYTTQVLAQDYASRIYHAIGIELRWKSSCPQAEEDAPATPFAPNLTTLGIEWAPKAPATISPAARASAHPFQPTGPRITLYLDRLRPMLQERRLAAAVLGHVLAHEIGHVLLGHNGHAQEGLMKAIWSAAEQRAMLCRPMPFTTEQGEQLRQTLDRRPVVLVAAR
jgi:Zn-dependent protease with chaperone function